MEMLNRNGTENKYENSVINGITGNDPEIPKRKGNSGQNPRNFFIYTTSVIYTTSFIWMKITSFYHNFWQCPKFLIISNISSYSGNFGIAEQFR